MEGVGGELVVLHEFEFELGLLFLFVGAFEVFIAILDKPVF